jgi:branched-chain amino acid transport system ATP-binding protein
VSGGDGDLALEVVGLNAFYGKSQVLFDLDVRIRKGEIAALLGRNGAGKTTTLMAIAGTVRSTGAAIRVEQSDLSQLPAYKRVRSGLAVVPSGSRAFPNLTVYENLTTVRPARNGGSGWAIDDVYRAFPKLAGLRNSRAGELSGGERQMLAVGRAMLARPKVLMLDEPSEGLAPMVVREIGSMLRRLNSEGLAVLLTEQNHQIALETADTAYFIEKGQIVWEGDARAAAKPEVIERYLAV